MPSGSGVGVPLPTVPLATTTTTVGRSSPFGRVHLPVPHLGSLTHVFGGVAHLLVVLLMYVGVLAVCVAVLGSLFVVRYLRRPVRPR